MADTQDLVVDEPNTGADPNAAPVDENDTLNSAPEGDTSAPDEHPSGEQDDERAAKELALSRGWVDNKEGWRGKGKWIDANTFNKRYEEVMPVVTAENRQMRKELREYNARMAEMQARVEQLTQAQQEQAEARQEIQMRTLVAQKAQAESEQDFQRANEIGNQILQLALDKRLGKQTNGAQQPAQQPYDHKTAQMIQDFADDNPVFIDNPEMQALLNREVKEMIAAGYPRRDRTLLDTAKESLEARFPAKFGIRQRQRAPMTEMNGTPRPNSMRSRTWADLKPDVAKMQDDFIDSTPELRKMGKDKARAGILKNLKPQDFRR